MVTPRLIMLAGAFALAESEPALQLAYLVAVAAVELAAGCLRGRA